MTTGLRREPITMASRQARGWLTDLTEGFAPGEDTAAEVMRQTRRATDARCPTCGTVGQLWSAYTDGKWTRIFLECIHCRDSREVFEPYRPRHATR